MKTISYQGQEVQAALVNYVSGDFNSRTGDLEGDEELFSDPEGQYYLRRKLNWLNVTSKRRASGRTLVHRISVNAAIFWATTRLNAVTGHLRHDAANILMENRGYFGPEERAAGWSKETIKGLINSGAPLPGLNAPEGAPGTDNPTVGLDAKAKAMVRRYLELTPYDYSSSDIVSGSVAYALEHAFDEYKAANERGHVDSPEFDDGGWGYVEEEIYEAQCRRTDGETLSLGHEDKPTGTVTADEVTVQITLPTKLYRQMLAMAAYDERCLSESIADSMEGDVQAWLESGASVKRQGGHNPRKFLAAFQRGLNAGQHPSVWPPRAALELDDVASAMLRDVCKNGDACRHPGEDPRDLVNAAVTFYLCADKTPLHDGLDLSLGEDALQRAKNERRKSAHGPNEIVDTAEPIHESAVEEMDW